MDKKNENKMFEIMKKADEGGWKMGGTQGSRLNIGGFTLLPPREFLFSHDFAKAVFGEKLAINTYLFIESNVKQERLEEWQYHLMRAVISKDPIDYYYKYISEKGKKK